MNGNLMKSGLQLKKKLRYNIQNEQSPDFRKIA